MSPRGAFLSTLGLETEDSALSHLRSHVLDYLRRDGLRHPNIVEMEDFFEDNVNYYIEMVPHGLPGMDLFDYIECAPTWKSRSAAASLFKSHGLFTISTSRPTWYIAT